MSQLARNVGRMTNEELIGLAKNRFLDHTTQIKIAEQPYRRAKCYLANNSGLCDQARNHLWSLPGYVLKCSLLSFGHYEGRDEFYHEVYNDHGDQIRRRSPWRLTQVFVGGFGYTGNRDTPWGPLTGPRCTPPGILEDIYERDVLNAPRKSDWNSRSIARGLIGNPSLPTDIVVKVSASHPDADIRNMALKRLGTLK